MAQVAANDEVEWAGSGIHPDLLTAGLTESQHDRVAPTAKMRFFIGSTLSGGTFNEVSYGSESNPAPSAAVDRVFDEFLRFEESRASSQDASTPVRESTPALPSVTMTPELAIPLRSIASMALGVAFFTIGLVLAVAGWLQGHYGFLEVAFFVTAGIGLIASSVLSLNSLRRRQATQRKPLSG